METKFNVAKKLIREAGNFVKSQMTKDVEVYQKTSHNDLVTQLDRQVQDLLIEVITSLFPDDHILAEENNVTHAIEDGNVWVIDPIDGTVNFIAQRDDFAIMLAYYEKGIGQFGLIYDVMADKLYSGGPNIPATCDDIPLPFYQSKPLNSQIIISNANMYARNDSGLANLIDQSLGCRTYGSAGISMARVLKGQAMAYFSHIYPWDYASASIIGKSLGYELLTLDGKSPDFKTRQKLMFIPSQEYEMIQNYLSN